MSLNSYSTLYQHHMDHLFKGSSAQILLKTAISALLTRIELLQSSILFPLL